MRVAVVESKDTHDVDQEPQYGHNYKLCRLFQGYRHKQTTNGFKNDTKHHWQNQPKSQSDEDQTDICH